MKIQRLELRNYGKFHNKVIEFGDGIQLLGGENEAGKTTLYTFIKSMLFGMERGRGRAAASDEFSRYEPWDNPAYYGGVMDFTSGGRNFRLERRFDKQGKKTELVCLDDGEQLSVEDGDLDMILGGLTSAGYEDTLAIGQLKAGTSRNLSAELKNYATNYYVAGHSELDLARAQEALTAERKEIDKQARKDLEEKQRKRSRIEQEISYVWRDIHHLDEELEKVTEALAYKEQKEKERRKTEAEIHIIDEIRPDKWRIHPLEIIGIAAVMVIAFILIARPWNFLIAIIIALAGGIYTWNRLKEGKRGAKTEPELMLEEITPEEELASKEKLLWERAHLSGERKEKQIQYENLQEQLEELDEFNDAYKEQDKKLAALKLASERLRDVSEDMLWQLRKDLDTKASEIMRAVTGGKYPRLLAGENLDMRLFCEGKIISAEQVSEGTKEQVYFALRMAAGDLMHEEEYPVILDDTFAFYDDRRLEDTLEYLAKSGRQVLLFTCQSREEAVLKRLGCAYRKIEL